MGVDQNKGSWGSYNRRSTANQPRSQRWQSRKGLQYHLAQKKTCIVHHSSIYTYIYIYIEVTRLYSVQSRQNGMLVRHVGSGQETWHGLVATLGGSSIASQSRINRGPIADFSIKWKPSRQKQYIADAVSDLGV